MAKEENGQMPSQLARVGSLCRLPSGHSSPHLPRSTELRSPVLLASPFLKGLSTWAGAMDSPRSHGLGTRHWWLQCRERLKLQSMAHVTQAQNRTRAAPGPRGADGVTRRKQQEHSWESCDALAANWTMTRQRGLRQWGLGTCQLGQRGHSDDTGLC